MKIVREVAYDGQGGSDAPRRKFCHVAETSRETKAHAPLTKKSAFDAALAPLRREDLPGALWTRAMIDDARCELKLPDMQRVVVAVDPSGARDMSERANAHIGIVVAGRALMAVATCWRIGAASCRPAMGEARDPCLS